MKIFFGVCVGERDAEVVHHGVIKDDCGKRAIIPIIIEDYKKDTSKRIKKLVEECVRVYKCQ